MKTTTRWILAGLTAVALTTVPVEAQEVRSAEEIASQIEGDGRNAARPGRSLDGGRHAVRGGGRAALRR